MLFHGKYIITIILSFLIILGCETGKNYRVKSPDDFAEFTKEKSHFKAISADGVRLRVYSIDNDPYGDMKMWKGAISNYLKGTGYQINSQKEVVASNNLKGDYTEYLYRYNGENYIYSVTLFVDRDNIYIIEAGGIESYYKKRRNSIKKLISEFWVNK